MGNHLISPRASAAASEEGAPGGCTPRGGSTAPAAATGSGTQYCRNAAAQPAYRAADFCIEALYVFPSEIWMSTTSERGTA